MKKIILVEDDSAIRESFPMIFNANEYDFTILAEGSKILNGEVETPDLFILDRQISGHSGLDICRFIKNNEKYKGTPVIMLSASPDIVEVAKSAGADDAIAKPYTLPRVREVVEMHIS